MDSSDSETSQPTTASSLSSSTTFFPSSASPRVTTTQSSSPQEPETSATADNNQQLNALKKCAPCGSTECSFTPSVCLLRCLHTLSSKTSPGGTKASHVQRPYRSTGVQLRRRKPRDNDHEARRNISVAKLVECGSLSLCWIRILGSKHIFDCHREHWRVRDGDSDSRD